MINTTLYEKIAGEVTASFKDEFLDCSGLESEIEKHFKALQEKKPGLTNGTLLMYKESDVKKDLQGNVHLACMKGKYAVYLYLNDHPATGSRYKARTIAPVGIITTRDDYFAFGVMAEHTSLAGKILAPGGAVDLNDVKQKDVDIAGCMARELGEEVGLEDISKQIESLRLFSFYRSQQRHALTIIHHAHLFLDKKQLARHFKEYIAKLKEKQEKPELSDLKFVSPDPLELLEFYKNPQVIDYLPGAIEILKEAGQELL